jgi:hypothetical protein
MKANELRIGNIVEFSTPKLPLNIHELSHIVTAEDIVNFGNGKILLTPVPLTEERLLKFRFHKRKAMGNYWFEKTYKKLLFITNDINTKTGLAFSTKLDHVFIHDMPGNEIRIKYVHVLQNVWFALTGQELISEKG